MNLTAYCDGGYDNTNKRNGYGSFRIYDDVSDTTVRLQFEDVHSSNEAEYQTFISLLAYLHEHYPTDSTIIVYSDSKMMCNQINAIWAVNALNLKEYYEVAIQEMQDFAGITLIWTPRKTLVRELGH